MRNPVITSSKIRTLPRPAHPARRPSRNLRPGGTAPILAATRSALLTARPSPTTTTRRSRGPRRLDGGVGVAEQQRPPRADEVDVPAAIDVDHVRAFTTVEEPRGAPDRAERPNGRVDATGDHRSRANEELLGSRHGPMLRKRCR